MEKITKIEMKEILKNIVAVMEENKQFLIELDGAMGDGDLGLTMSSGFRAVYDEIDHIEDADLGKVVMRLGMKMNATVPSTMGTLISTCFVKAALPIKGKLELGLADLVAMGRAATEGVMKRGKSKVGDKTMLDALVPAVEALEASQKDGKSMKEAQAAALAAAEAGVEKTKSMQSMHGRAAYYAEKSVGRQDPGATAVMLMVKGIQQTFV
jgi:dihydroxyacetone kinase, phosphoprotein-dependent, L subunit